MYRQFVYAIVSIHVCMHVQYIIGNVLLFRISVYKNS